MAQPDVNMEDRARKLREQVEAAAKRSLLVHQKQEPVSELSNLGSGPQLPTGQDDRMYIKYILLLQQQLLQLSNERTRLLDLVLQLREDNMALKRNETMRLQREQLLQSSLGSEPPRLQREQLIQSTLAREAPVPALGSGGKGHPPLHSSEGIGISYYSPLINTFNTSVPQQHPISSVNNSCTNTNSTHCIASSMDMPPTQATPMPYVGTKMEPCKNEWSTTPLPQQLPGSQSTTQPSPMIGAAPSMLDEIPINYTGDKNIFDSSPLPSHNHAFEFLTAVDGRAGEAGGPDVSELLLTPNLRQLATVLETGHSPVMNPTDRLCYQPPPHTQAYNCVDQRCDSGSHSAAVEPLPQHRFGRRQNRNLVQAGQPLCCSRDELLGHKKPKLQ